MRLALVALLCRPAIAAGFQTAMVPDAGNPDIAVGIWYPSTAPAHPVTVGLHTQTVATGGTVAGTDLKLVLMSHGQGGEFYGHLDTAATLADAGFVAVAPTHTGDNLHDQSRVLRIQDRSRQLHVVADWMLCCWAGHISLNARRIGVFGFSAGGFTALVAAGAVPNMALVAPHCADHPAEFTCALIRRNAPAGVRPPPAGAWVHDPRIRAAVVVAPALGYTFGRAGLSGVTIPVQLWRAELDHVLPQPFYAQAVRDALPTPPDYHVAAGADHMDFLAPCDPDRAQYAPIVCDSAPGFDRAALHRRFDAAVVAFFRAHLDQPGD